VVFDHDVIDGAPAARFVRRLVELIESGYGLEKDQTLPVIDVAPIKDDRADRADRVDF
jgi:hypothetical protein